MGYIYVAEKGHSIYCQFDAKLLAISLIFLKSISPRSMANPVPGMALQMHARFSPFPVLFLLPRHYIALICDRRRPVSHTHGEKSFRIMQKHLNARLNNASFQEGKGEMCHLYAEMGEKRLFLRNRENAT